MKLATLSLLRKSLGEKEEFGSLRHLWSYKKVNVPAAVRRLCHIIKLNDAPCAKGLSKRGWRNGNIRMCLRRKTQ